MTLIDQTIDQIREAIEMGMRKRLKELMEQAIEDGATPEEILEKGLVPAMENVSRQYKNEQVFVPEVILASQAMNVGTTLLENYMEKPSKPYLGRAVIGTVKGDLHSIGKNTVAMLLRGVGIETFDLGYDVPADIFVRKAEEYRADIICISAMLTTTMGEMKKVVGKLANLKRRSQYIIMVGGAPVTEAFAVSIGADIYTRDAGSAALMAQRALLGRKSQGKGVPVGIHGI